MSITEQHLFELCLKVRKSTSVKKASHRFPTLRLNTHTHHSHPHTTEMHTHTNTKQSVVVAELKLGGKTSYKAGVKLFPQSALILNPRVFSLFLPHRVHINPLFLYLFPPCSVACSGPEPLLFFCSTESRDASHLAAVWNGTHSDQES